MVDDYDNDAVLFHSSNKDVSKRFDGHIVLYIEEQETTCRKHILR